MNRHSFFKIGLTFTAMATAATIWAGTYSSYSVKGNDRMADSVVLGIAGLVPGKPISDAELNQAVQRLYTSGQFAEVTINTSGSHVTLIVIQNASVSGVYFEGNKKIKDEQLASVVEIGARSGLDRQKIQEDVQAIKQIYAARSFFAVEIEPVFIDNGNGTYKLIFEIDEGDVSEVERLTFSGNQQVSDWALRRVVGTREAGVFSSLFSSDNFASQKLQDDKSRIEEYYAERGFYNARVEVAESDYDAAGDFFVTYRIYEGQKFSIGNVTISSEIPGVKTADYNQFIETKAGRVYKKSDIVLTLDAIEQHAEARGLAFLRVDPDVTVNEGNATIDINYRLVNGDRVYVERIDIRGNDTTIERVIRREFDTAEGDPLNSRKVSEGTDNVRNTGHFSNVGVQTRDGSASDQKIIDVDVTERDAGQLALSASYDGEGFGGLFSFSHSNFMGRGQYVALNVSANSGETSGTISFREPRMFDRKVSGGFDIYLKNTANGYAGYSNRKLGFEPSLTFPITKDSKLALNYFVYQNDLYEFKDAASPYVQDYAGEHVSSGIAATFTLDKTDSQNDATNGFILRLGAKYAGLGGDDNWVQYAAKAKYYKPLLNNILQFSIEGEAGSIEGLNGQAVPIYERFYLGGNKTLKGFENGGIGPRHKDGEYDSSLGGNQFAALRTSLEFPLPGFFDELGLSGAVWWEGGSVWGLDDPSQASNSADFEWRASTGASLIWNLGLQNIELSWNNPYQYDEDYDVIDEWTISAVRHF